MIRAAILILAFAAAAPAWVESVEFPWNEYPRQLWERELVWMKNIGVRHVSFPPATNSEQDQARLAEAIQIVRRLELEADLEGPVPDALQALTRAHGGPLTEPPAGTPARISVLDNMALTRSREILESGAPALIWTDVEDRMGTDGYHAGAVSFGGQERAATTALRRNALLSAYWGKSFPALHEITGPKTPQLPGIPAGVTVRQFLADSGVSLVSVANTSASPWTGDVKALYPTLKRAIALGVSVPARDVLWLPVNVPLMAGPLCKDCSAFASVDHLVYATAELTAMEYENGILAMEFSAPAGGEVLLQLSREPYGPYVAGGRPTVFDWDDHELRARLKIPPGTGAGNRVRIGLAIEPPDATAFFDSARVLVIGETNHLPATFSSEAIAQRSRLRIAPPYPASQDANEKEALKMTYRVTVPPAAVHGDHADLAIEADGIQMTHTRPQLLRPASLRFADAIDVHLAGDSALPLYPATVPVNQRAGREVTVTVRNNAPEIRNFHLELMAEGLEFLPAKIDTSVGASASRDLTFRVFAENAAAGVRAGIATLSGAAAATEPVLFVVIPQNSAAAYAAGEFSVVESARYRASFSRGRWLELVDKDNNVNLLPATGIPYAEGQKISRPEDLLPLVPKPKKQAN